MLQDLMTGCHQSEVGRSRTAKVHIPLAFTGGSARNVAQTLTPWSPSPRGKGKSEKGSRRPIPLTPFPRGKGEQNMDYAPPSGSAVIHGGLQPTSPDEIVSEEEPCQWKRRRPES